MIGSNEIKNMIAKLNVKKAQAAMEFLMTYGWAILVVLAAITALAYFGVLSPSKFFPESCTLSPTAGMACLDFRVDQTQATLMLINSGGRDVVVNNVTLGDCSTEFAQSFPDGSSHVFVLDGCDFGSVGRKIKEELALSYTDQNSGFTKTASGSVAAMIN